MMTIRAASVVVTLVLLTSACGGSKPTVSTSASTLSPSRSGSPSPVPPASPTPSPRTATSNSFDLLPSPGPAPGTGPQIACSGSIGPTDPVAIVQLHGAAPTSVLRDYADPAASSTVCQFGPAYVDVQQLIDSRHVVVRYSGNGTTFYALVDLPGVHFTWFQLPEQYATFLSISPALDEVVWLGSDVSNADRVHVTTRAGDSIVAALAGGSGRCGSPEDAKQAAFSPSGQHMFVLDQHGGPRMTSLLLLSGTKQELLLTPPTGGWAAGDEPNMALWSPTGDTLYYRQRGDVWRWQPGGDPQRYLSGVKWYYPTISGDSGALAYSVSHTSGLHDVYLVDLAHPGDPRHIGQGARNLPVFLTSTLLWYKSEGEAQCGPSGSQPLIYDLSDGSESPTIVDYILAVWPATSSNF
ncbi:MAG TPA: hypothetical protein VG266_10325 [Candidatus Dormibacteraeota bacterium]|nr:hypothetical protein [Candidatus Dormibacteraeota bacterium]